MSKKPWKTWESAAPDLEEEFVFSLWGQLTDELKGRCIRWCYNPDGVLTYPKPGVRMFTGILSFFDNPSDIQCIIRYVDNSCTVQVVSKSKVLYKSEDVSTNSGSFLKKCANELHSKLCRQPGECVDELARRARVPEDWKVFWRKHVDAMEGA